MATRPRSDRPSPVPPPPPPAGLAPPRLPASPVTVPDRVAALSARAEAGEGHWAAAVAHLRRAEQYWRLASQLRDQIRAIKAVQPPVATPRNAIRVSHLSQALKRAEGDAEKYLVLATQALDAPVGPGPHRPPPGG